MTLDQFYAVTVERIPTPAEFVAFAEHQRWRLSVKPDGTGTLHADPADPMAVAFARMLSREPYRTNVCRYLESRTPQPDPRPDPEPDPPPQPPEECRVCGRTVDAGDREALRGVNPLCTEGGGRQVTDGHGMVHPASERCPYKDNP